VGEELILYNESKAAQSLWQAHYSQRRGKRIQNRYTFSIIFATST